MVKEMKLSPLYVVALEEEVSKELIEEFEVLITGVGKVNATYNLTHYLNTYKNKFNLIINFGTAGSNYLNPGTFVDCTRFYEKDMDCKPLGFEPFQTPFEKEIIIDVSKIKPQVSWGTSPEMVIDFDDSIPNTSDFPTDKRKSIELAKKYMGIDEEQKLSELKFDKVFIGSCTNSRIEDLRDAAKIVEGKKISEKILEAIVVPGSGLVKKMAEEEGLDKIFTQAGFIWRDPGCSMCLGMNPDQLKPYERCASTSNRNFEGRQGNLGRTHLMSPRMAAKTALKGKIGNL